MFARAPIAAFLTLLALGVLALFALRSGADAPAEQVNAVPVAPAAQKPEVRTKVIRRTVRVKAKRKAAAAAAAGAGAGAAPAVAAASSGPGPAPSSSPSPAPATSSGFDDDDFDDHGGDDFDDDSSGHGGDDFDDDDSGHGRGRGRGGDDD